MSDPWSLLDIAKDASVDDVRRAYARELKITRPDEDPEGFQKLVTAREIALRHAERNGAAKSHAKPSPRRIFVEAGPDEAPVREKAPILDKTPQPPAPRSSANPRTTEVPPYRTTPPDPRGPDQPGQDAERHAPESNAPGKADPPPYRKRSAPPDRQDVPPAPPKKRSPQPSPPSHPRELTVAETFDKHLRQIEEAGDEGGLDPSLLQALTQDIASLSTVQRRYFETRIAHVLAKRIVPHAKRSRKVGRNNILADDAFCAFALAMSEEFGWREADRTLHPILGTDGLLHFRHFLTAMADAHNARMGHGPSRQTAEGHVDLGKLDLENSFGAEAPHFASIMAAQAKRSRWPLRWQAFLGAPFWALKYRLYGYAALWIVAALLFGQSALMTLVMPATPEMMWRAVAGAVLVAVCLRISWHGDRAVLRRIQSKVIRADHAHMFHPVIRGNYLKSQRPRLFLSDPLILLLTVFAFGFLANSDEATKSFLRKRAALPAVHATPLPPVQFPYQHNYAPVQQGPGISIPRRPVDKSR